MEACAACGNMKLDISSYSFHYGKITDRRSRMRSGKLEINQDFSITPEPISILICSNCVRKKLNTHNMLVNLRYISPVAGVICFILFFILKREGLFFLFPLSFFLMWVSGKLPTEKILDMNSAGEHLAIDKSRSNLEKQGYDYFCTAVEYTWLPKKPSHGDITKMHENKNADGLIKAVWTYGSRSNISNKNSDYELALLAIGYLRDIGTSDLILKLESLAIRLRQDRKEDTTYGRDYQELGKGSEKFKADAIIRSLVDTIALLKSRYE